MPNIYICNLTMSLLTTLGWPTCDRKCTIPAKDEAGGFAANGDHPEGSLVAKDEEVEFLCGHTHGYVKANEMKKGVNITCPEDGIFPTSWGQCEVSIL